MKADIFRGEFIGNPNRLPPDPQAAGELKEIGFGVKQFSDGTLVIPDPILGIAYLEKEGQKTRIAVLPH